MAYFLPNCAELPLSNICYLFRWSPYVTFSCLHPLWPPQKGPFQPLLIIRRDYQGLGDDTPTLHLPPPASDYMAPAAAFSSDLQGPRKGSYCCCPALAMPRTHLSSDFNASSSPDALRCGTWKSGLDVERHWPWRHILTVQRGRTVLSKPHPFTATQFPFLFPDLNQCLFFSSSQQPWYLVPCCCPWLHHPLAQQSPPFICLGPLTVLVESALKELFSLFDWGHWDSRPGWVEQTCPQA